MDFDFIDKWPNLRVLVVGEVGIDEYIWGEAARISPEAPVPVVEVTSCDDKLGMAANVAQNIVSLGGQTQLLTVTGEDPDADRLHDQLRLAGITDARLMRDASRPTLRKVRVLAQKQHVVRVDYEKSHPLSTSLVSRFNAELDSLIERCDGVIVQDYGKGIWNSDTLGFISRVTSAGKPVFVDPSRHAVASTYGGAYLMTPNLIEAQALAEVRPASDKNDSLSDKRLEQILDILLERAELEHAIVTCGAAGMVAKSRDVQELIRVPAVAREVFDVTGAGDTVIAAIALSMLAGASLSDAMRVANAAAGLVVARVGTVCVTQSDLVAELARL